MDLFKEIHNFVKKRPSAILYGSRAWGGAILETRVTQLGTVCESDWDYVMCKDDFENVIAFVNNMSLFKATAKGDITLEKSNYYLMSYFIHVGEHTLNIVCMRADDFEAWTHASAMMRRAPKRLLQDRKMRHLLFETLLSILKQA